MNRNLKIHTFVLGIASAISMTGCTPSSPKTKEGTPPATVSSTPASEPPKISESVKEEPLPLPQGWMRVAGVDAPSMIGTDRVLPATVLSDDGVEVVIFDTSKTIVGNDDIIAVMEALGIGDLVFAAPTSTVTKSGRQAKHHFLFNRTTGVEGILSLGGTLFVGNSLRRHGKLAQPLRDAGTAMIIVDELQTAPEKVRKTAAVFGYATQGEALADKVQLQLDQAGQIATKITRKPRVVVLSATGGGGTPTVAGADTAAAKLIRLAGGVNIGDESKVSDYSQLSNEGMVAAAPEVVLVSENDLESFGGAEGLLKAYPTLQETPAGIANRVWVMPDLQLKLTSIANGAGAIALAKAFQELGAKLPQ